MTLETFFVKFDLFADAPDAVAKLRGLVLELAVQGRLVQQLAKEGTAHALLERVASTAKSRGRDAGESEDTNAPFPIPETWAWVRLPRVLKKLTDGTHHSPRNGPSGAFMYVTAKNIKTDGVSLDGITYVCKEVHHEIYSRCDPSFGDVLYIKDGATTGIATINQVKEPFSMLSSVALLKPSEAIFNRYLLWAMRSPFFYAETRGAMKGAAITRVTLSVMAASFLPLPPLAEQKRIVAKVDELMVLCDRLEAQQQEREARHAALARASLARFADAPTPANLQLLFHPSYAIPPADLRKSILTLAVQGKLVPQDPNDEPAEELLKRVDAEREQLVKSKTIRRQDFLGPVADDAIPFDIPASWQWRYLADICFLITDGAHHTPQYLESGVPFLSVKDVSGGSIDFSSTRFISEEAHRELCKRCPPGQGDILLTKIGTTGIAVTVDEEREFSIFVSLALLKFSQPNLDGRYLKHLINSPFVKQQSADNTQGIGNKNLVLRLINRFTVPIPPLAEQRRIVAKVEQLMALVDALETQLKASRATAANLLEALVAELTAS